MFKKRNATIGKVEIKLVRSLISLEHLASRPYLVPINIEEPNFSEYLGPIVVSMPMRTSNNNQYSPLIWDLVSEAYPMQDYEQLCSLAKLLKGRDGVHVETLKGEKVTIIVDDDKYTREETIFAIGKDDKFIIPFWILSEAPANEQKNFYTEEEAKMLLEKIVPIVLSEIE